MGATEEQMKLVSEAGVTHVSYVLILYSVAFVLYLCEFFLPSLNTHIHTTTNTRKKVVNLLIHLYAISTPPFSLSSSLSTTTTTMNGHSRTRQKSRTKQDSALNGHTVGGTSSSGGGHVNGGVTDEFELEGLISDGDVDDGEEEYVDGKRRRLVADGV